MVKVESVFLLNVGDQAPDFALPEPKTEETVALKDAALENGLLVAFICNHCPFVIWISAELEKLGKDLAEKQVGMVGISSSDHTAYPADSPEKIKEASEGTYTTFRYLIDENQEVTKSYGANCTPDFFLLNKEGKVYYRGQLDGSRPNSDTPVTGEDLRKAVDLMIAGEPPPEVQKRSLGCSIKWKPGNEPEYFKV